MGETLGKVIIKKLKMAAIFGGTKIFWKLGHLLSRVTLRIKNFVEIALSSTVFEIQAFLCLACIFGKWQTCWNLERLVFTDTLWVKNFAEIPLVNFYFMRKMVSKSTHISLSIVLYVYLMSLYFHFNSNSFRKLNMTPIFGEEKFFGKLESSLFRHPLGQTFRQNRSISHG